MGMAELLRNTEIDEEKVVDTFDLLAGNIDQLAFDIARNVGKPIEKGWAYSFDPRWNLQDIRKKAKSGYGLKEYIDYATEKLNKEQKTRVNKVIKLTAQARINEGTLPFALTPDLIMKLDEKHLEMIDGLKDLNGGRILKRIFPTKRANYRMGLR